MCCRLKVVKTQKCDAQIDGQWATGWADTQTYRQAERQRQLRSEPNKSLIDRK